MLKSSIFYVGTQKMQLHSAREGPNLLPDIVKYHLEDGYSKWHQKKTTQNSSPLWEVLGIHKSSLHWLFYTRLFAWRKDCYQWLWMCAYLRVAYFATVPNSERITHRWKIFAPQISVNVHITFTHLYFRYAGNFAEWSQLQSMVSVSSRREGPN